MYWEWTTMNGAGRGDIASKERSTVLERLPPEASREVVLPVVRHIVSTLGISQPAQSSSFTNDAEVEWALQVVCYGLSLPLIEHEIIKDCVSIYCEWLSCLVPVSKISVPKPVIDRPNFFARKMINHLYHLFTPRKGEAQDTINRQAVLCHRVLRTLQNVMKTSEILDTETWQCVLLFLIAVNDALLSPPSIKEDIGDQLCERVLSVLFEVWLLACSKSFPSPPLWKTLRESCQNWRHRSNLFEQWNRINLLLVGRVLIIMYGHSYVKLGDDEQNLLSPDMSNDCVVQTWFRFLHTVGNPVELTQPTIISQTQNFLQYAIASQVVVDPCQHPCLSVLPLIFHQAMRGISTLVDAFLGLPRTSLLGLTSGSRSKDTSSIPSSTNSSLQNSSVSISNMESFPSDRHALAASRPKVNSILHLFGLWLFEAALISCESSQVDGEVRRTSRGSAVPAALPESIDIPQAITIDKYYQGRAEALGTLCRIFCSKKTGEDILPAYLARFYITIRKGLKDNRIEVLASILSNSPNLLRVDLDGVTMLVPVIVSALEAVLPNKEVLRGDLRRSAIQLLLSILPLPLHFMNVQIKDLVDKNSTGTTFIQLKPRLANLLINSLQIETDSSNIQMLLGGLMMFVLDTCTFEETDKLPLHLGIESPTNLLSSENTSMRSLSEYSNSFDEHTLGFSDTDSQIDSAHALFVRTTYLVCHRLISTWKIDLPVSLAALELLNGLARTKVHDQDPLECRRIVKWVSDFIIYQAGRPPPAHSKDLHSSIVAAFTTITTWLTEHPYLLEDKESLAIVLEVVELGISGTKSQGKPGEALKLKDEKELKPVSQRIQNAAEALLAVIFEQVGRYIPNNAVKATSLVDEFVLLNPVDSQVSLTKEEIVNQFRYFVIDNSIMIALLEEPLGNDQDPQPTVTAVLRGPTGRHAWSLQLKGKSFSSNSNNPGRPLPMNDVGVRYEISHRYFPFESDRITLCKADRAIPPLDSSKPTSDPDSLEQSRLSIILENQIRLEKSVANMIREESNESYPNLRTEASPPPVSQEFQTSRLLLSHLGFISAQNSSGTSKVTSSETQHHRHINQIDSHSKMFITELDILDGISFRTNDTVHIFYVRSGQRKYEDILANVQSKGNVHPHFLEFIVSLGWPVTVNRHVGWTGSVSTSWKRLNSNSNESTNLRGKDGDTKSEVHGGSLYNGEKHVLYWADGTSEIAFVVPTGKSTPWNESAIWTMPDSGSGGSSTPGPGSLERSGTGADEKTLRASSMESEKHLGNSDGPSKARKALAGKLCDTKIFTVWLESFEDAFHFPAADLLGCTYTGSEGTKPVEPSLIIFIHSLRNGLFRIHMEGQHLRMGLATPLVDGMVVSRRVLGNLVRQTALNMARRKRLENEHFQPPHVRRKLKIQEILHKFPCVMSEPDFYTAFYQSPPTATYPSSSIPSP